jgi:hypothetical protein
VGHRWGRIHGGNVAVHRPRVRGFDGHEIPLPTWTAAQAENWLGRWAMNLMLINVSTRKFRRAVPVARGRSAGDCRGRRLEVGGLAPVRGVVGRTETLLSADKSTAVILESRFNPAGASATRLPLGFLNQNRVDRRPVLGNSGSVLRTPT